MVKERNLIGLAVIAVLAACGGGGGGGSSVPAGVAVGAPTTAATSAPNSTPTLAAGQALTRFSVSKTVTTSSSTRRAQFVDPNTQSITLTLLQTNGVPVNGTPQGPFNVAQGATGCTLTGNNLTCVFQIAAPIGNDVFLATTFSGLNGVGQLGSGAVALAVTQNSSNQANLTLTGPVSSVVAVSNNGANLDTLWNGNGYFIPITFAEFTAQNQLASKRTLVGASPAPTAMPTAIPSARLYLIAADTTGAIILNPTTYNQPIVLTLNLNGGPANATLSDTPPTGFGVGVTSTSVDGGTVQVFTPSDVVTLAIIPTVPSPFQFYPLYSYANFPSVTISFAAPPSGFVPLTFPFTVEIEPSPSPSPSPSPTGPAGGIQVIGS